MRTEIYKKRKRKACFTYNTRVDLPQRGRGKVAQMAANGTYKDG